MPRQTPSLFVAMLRTVVDWANAPHGVPKSGRAERRRRSRQRLKARAAFSDFFQSYCQDLDVQVEALQHLVASLNAERNRLHLQIQIHQECMDDLGRRNACLLDLCAASQHEAEHWKRFIEGEREREAEIARKLQLN
ncbi:hypothetical protein ABLE93_14895 [Xanthobacter sp. KR7-65]|uniref:hypothetical protein n=1 Tax=Xanthobacter sp. KR7-65 TaxID=3156612 RepID=UPI0032B45A64